jgi:hypothetical protein
LTEDRVIANAAGIVVTLADLAPAAHLGSRRPVRP